MWSEIAAFMFVVYDIQNWNVNFADIESSLKKQEGGCGDITAWDFSDSTTYGVAAKFNLPTLIASGCVERAIESAGGPSSSDVSCQGHGTHVFDGGDSVQDILNEL
jgi:chitinase